MDKTEKLALKAQKKKIKQKEKARKKRMKMRPKTLLLYLLMHTAAFAVLNDKFLTLDDLKNVKKKKTDQ